MSGVRAWRLILYWPCLAGKLWTWRLAVAIAIVKGDARRHIRMRKSTMSARLYARGFLFCAIGAPLFSAGVALSVGRAWRFCRSAASAPAIRICSTVSEAEFDLEPG